MTKCKLAACCIVAGLILLGPYAVNRAMSSSQVLHLVSPPVAATRDEQRPHSLSVLAYNIAHGRGLATSNWGGGDEKERHQRMDEMVRMLQSHDPDILILNEVDFNASWSFGLNQAAYLARELAMPYRVEQRNIDLRFIFSTWKFGNAILSKYPISKVQLVDLPDYARWETILAGKKRAVHAEVDLHGEAISVIAVHLSHRSEGLRFASAQRIAEYVSTLNGPVIIGGDFNSSPKSFRYHMIDEMGNNAMDYFADVLDFQRFVDHAPTFPAQDPQRTIDWFLLSKSLEVTQSHVIDSELSDHRPVYINISLP